jgi:tRNA pseudouridine55 synthase
MRGVNQILPGTGRGTMRSMVEGALQTYIAWGRVPSTKPLRVLVPLPVNGEDLG